MMRPWEDRKEFWGYLATFLRLPRRLRCGSLIWIWIFFCGEKIFIF